MLTETNITSKLHYGVWLGIRVATYWNQYLHCKTLKLHFFNNIVPMEGLLFKTNKVIYNNHVFFLDEKQY